MAQTATGPTANNTALEERVAALEAEVTHLQQRVEQAEIREAMRKSQEQFDHGEGIPVREALETLRRKHNIPVQ